MGVSAPSLLGTTVAFVGYNARMLSPNLSSPSLPPRAAVRVGFYFALGVVLLLVLGVAARRFLEATLAVSLPFVLGLVLALLLDPLADKLERRGLKRIVATSIVFGGLLLVLVGLGVLLVPMLAQQASDLATNGPQYIAGIQSATNKFLSHHHKIGPVTLPSTAQELGDQISARASGLLSTGGTRVTGFLLGSVTLLVQLILALILTFYLLMDIDRLRARLFYFMPDKHRDMTSKMGKDVGGVFSDYLAGLLKVCVLYAIVTVLLLYGLSYWHHALARYALLVGVAAGILYAVPYVGSLSTAVVTFLVSFAAAQPSGHGLVFGLVAVGLSLVVNQVFDGVVTPKVVGGGVGLHPVIAVFALVIGAELFGIWGMLLSVPVAGSIQAILFRVFPKLSTPTPDTFLRKQGIQPDDMPSPKTRQGEDAVAAP